MDIAAIAISAVLLVYCIANRLYLAFPTGLVTILLMSQMAFYFVHNGAIYNPLYEICNYGGLKYKYLSTQALYASISALSVLTMRLGTAPLDVPDIFKRLRTGPITSRQSALAIGFFIFFLALHAVLFLVVTDWDKLWLHHTYLESLADRGVVYLLGFEFVSGIIRSTVFMYVLSIFGLFLALTGNSQLSKCVLLSFAIFYFVLFLSFDSRFAAAFPAFLCFAYAVGNYRAKGLVIPALVLLCAAVLMYSLNGRGMGDQGVSAIAHTFGSTFAGPPLETLGSLILNITEGIYETSESLQMNASFPEIYKILSFSPLPSAVDGFRNINELFQIRLHEFMPMSGAGEAFHFGAIYIVALVAMIIAVVRIHLMLARRNPAMFLMCNILVTFSIYHMLAYPLRNALHFAWLAVALSLVPWLVEVWKTLSQMKSSPLSKIGN